jgi:hypothetical protein
MAEFWKSAERYWCKHCSVFVRDTKLERQNHDATAKHQSALKRFLRDIHRNHEQQERNKDRARQEIDRLNGVVSGDSRSGATPPSAAPSPGPRTGAPSETDLKKQREQLAQMGVQMPDTFRPEMAMPGEWTVTNTRVIETKTDEEKTAAKALGVRKREVTEEDKEEEDAVKSLFKKPKKWGRDTKLTSSDNENDLDALLSGPLTTKKAEDKPDTGVKLEEEHRENDPSTKAEPGFVKEEHKEPSDYIKKEPDDAIEGVDAVVPNEANEPPSEAVVFKKRKAKTLRQK